MYKLIDVQIHTPCKISIYYQTKYKDYKFYLVENFSSDKNNIKHFLQNLNITTILSSKSDKQINSTLFQAEGLNSITLGYIDDKNNHDGLQPAENTTFCTLSKKFIDAMLTNTPVKNRYTPGFLDIMFNPQNPEKKSKFYYEDNDVLILPNNLLYFTTSNTQLDDVIFMVIIKPDNYINLQNDYLQYHKLYQQVKQTKESWTKNIQGESKDLELWYNLCQKLSNQPYISLYHLSLQHVDKLKRIEQTIYNFYSKFDPKKYIKDNIKINVSSKESRNFWVHISTSFRNVYETNYDYVRLTQIMKTSSLEYVIDHLASDNSLDNLHKQSYPCSFIKEKNLSQYCTKSKSCESVLSLKDIKLSYSEKVDQNVNLNPLIINGKFNSNIDIRRVLSSKISKLSSLCSQSVCIKLEGKYYLINIIPRTPAYIQHLFINKKHDEFKSFYNGLQQNIVQKLSYPGTQLELSNYDKLKYNIEIIHLECFDCDGISFEDCELDPFMKEIKFAINRRFILNLKCDNTISNKYTNCLNDNFVARASFIIYNLLHSLFSIYGGCRTNDCLSKISNLLQKILNLEESYNNMYNKTHNNSTYVYKKLLNITNSNNKVDIDKVVSLLNNNGYIKFFGKDIPYIGIPGRKYLFSGIENDFKYIIWYTTPLILDIEQINNILDKLTIYINKVTISGDRNLLEDIELNSLQFYELYGQSPQNVDYLYNIMGLFNKDGSFNDYKLKLDKFIDSFAKHMNLELYYPMFHYFTYPKFSLLHIQIYLKNTIGSDRGVVTSLRNKIAYGKYGNFAHELSNDINMLYWSLDKRYYFNHNIYTPIPDIKNVLSTMDQSIKNLFKNYSNDIILKKYIKEEIMSYWYTSLQSCSNIIDDLIDKNFNYIVSTISNLLDTYS